MEAHRKGNRNLNQTHYFQSLRPYMYDLNTIELVWTKITISVRDNGAMDMSFQALQLTEHTH